MQPQQQILTSPVTQQQQVTLIANSESEKSLIKRKKVIYALGKAELAIGCLMTAIGIFTSIYSASSRNSPGYYFYSVTSVGEGIWCGVWVIIAGGLGMGAGARTSTPGLINTHLGFSIVGAFTSGLLCGLTATFSAVGSTKPFVCALMATMSIISFITAVLLIVSASYCCYVNPAGCCGKQVYVRGLNLPTAQYINTPTVVPVQGTFFHQNPIPAQPGSSSMYYGNPVSAPSTSLPVKSDTLIHVKDSPPAYQSN